MSVRIVGLGSPLGDDRAGWAAVEELARRPLPPDCELHVCAHPAADLLPLLDGARHAVLVDALVDGGAPGRVRRCSRAELAARPARASSHGVTVDDLLALAAALGSLPPRLTLLGVSIEPAAAAGAGLSPPVRAALPRLADAVLAALAADEPERTG